jgi:hypothetical protein
MSVRWLRLLLLTCFFLAPGQSVVAADQELAATPAVLACDVPYRSVDEVLDLWMPDAGTPQAPTERVQYVGGEEDLPPGDPVDAATLDAINRVMR